MREEEEEEEKKNKNKIAAIGDIWGSIGGIWGKEEEEKNKLSLIHI